MVPQTGSPRAGIRVRTLALGALAAALLTACGGGGDEHSDGSGAIPVGKARISGRITYDYVPTAVTTDAANETQAKLDYPKTEQRAVRHTLVEALSEDGTKVLGQTITDDNGAYSIIVPKNNRMYVRVTAEITDGADTDPNYRIMVRDNTSPAYAIASGSASVYSMRGDAVSVTALGRRIDLNAGSGWTGAGYGAPPPRSPSSIRS
jgi:hypothetical protein